MTKDENKIKVIKNILKRKMTAKVRLALIMALKHVIMLSISVLHIAIMTLFQLVENSNESLIPA